MENSLHENIFGLHGVLMTVLDEVQQILVDVLQLQISPKNLTASMPLLDNMAELDSMTVVSLITALEEYYGFVIEDDEISAEVFETVGSLVSFVKGKI